MSSASQIESVPIPTATRSKKYPRWPRQISLAILVAMGLGAFFVLGTNALIVLGTNGKVWNEASEADRAEVAIVPGALVNEDGSMSLMLADRVNQAVALYRAGKVEKILVSGDHGRWTYDEPTTMRRALVAAGVPAGVVFTDHAGFNTRATMERARSIFGITDATIVTQGFHMDRSLYLANQAGLTANGLTSDLHGYGRQGIRSDVREVASRTKAVLETLFGSSVVGGEPVPIDGPARASWGPEAPAGTPPAGAPPK